MVSEAGGFEAVGEDGWHGVGPPMARNPALSGEDQWGGAGTGPVRGDGLVPARTPSEPLLPGPRRA